MSQIELESVTQQVAKDTEKRNSEAKQRSAAANFAAQMRSAVNLTNTRVRAMAVQSGAMTVVRQTVVAAQTLPVTSKKAAQPAPKPSSTKAGGTVVASSTTSSAGNTGAESGILSSSDATSGNALLQATQHMQELNQSFNLQYLQLQENEQAENRQFTCLSNVIKMRHDTVKNSISNLK